MGLPHFAQTRAGLQMSCHLLVLFLLDVLQGFLVDVLYLQMAKKKRKADFERTFKDSTSRI